MRLLTLFSIFLVFSCQNDQTREVQTNGPITIAKTEKDSVNIDLEQYVAVKHLINPKQLSAWLLEKGAPLIIIDVRSKEKYEKGHLITARNLQRSDYQSNAYPYKGMRLEKELFAKVLGDLGATANARIVLYDDVGNTDALRLWWMLSLYGHEQCFVLNGGILNVESGLIKTELPEITPKKFEFIGAERMELLASKADVINAIKDKNTFLLDCRTSAEFTGATQKKDAFRAGRIPMSTNIEHSESIAYERSSTFRDVDDLMQRFKAIPKDKNIIVYCQSGVRSAHVTFVLRELLGYSNVANYDGSWIEWSYDKSLTIE